MSDDFEDQLRAAHPAEVPADLMRRLRHAEPANLSENWWRRPALMAIAALAAAALVVIFADPLRWLAADTAAKRHHATAKAIPPLEAASFDFGGPIAMNIRMGASPDLIPVSLRSAYDTHLFNRSDWPGGDLNLRVESLNLNNTTRN